jgi:hypothetical protein
MLMLLQGNVFIENGALTRVEKHEAAADMHYTFVPQFRHLCEIAEMNYTCGANISLASFNANVQSEVLTHPTTVRTNTSVEPPLRLYGPTTRTARFALYK